MAGEVIVRITEKGRPDSPYNVTADFSGAKTFRRFEEMMSENLARIAREVLKEEQDRGFDKNPRIKVDRRLGKPIEQVRPFGKIEIFSRLKDLQTILDIYTAIERRSPERTGLYRRSNYVLVNNKLVATNASQLKRWTQTIQKNGLEEIATIRFINVTPYASRLEFKGTRKSITGSNAGKNLSKGRTAKARSKGRKFGTKIKKPNGAYYLAYVSTRKIRGFFDKTKFEFIPNGFQGIRIDTTGVFRTSYANTPKNRNKRRVGKPYVYPSLLFTLSPEGVSF